MNSETSIADEHAKCQAGISWIRPPAISASFIGSFLQAKEGISVQKLN